jgi:hypothetical protein
MEDYLQGPNDAEGGSILRLPRANPENSLRADGWLDEAALASSALLSPEMV